MKTIACSLAILAAAVSSAAPAAPAAAQQFEIQVMTSDLQNAESVRSATKEAKQLRVLSAPEVKRAFDLAARDGGRQAIEISCAPADSEWCAKDFVAACDKADGGMSTNPDGGVTCSLPQYD